MGVISMFVCALFCQTFILTSFAVIIPVAETAATVAPDNPSSLPVTLNREPSLSSPTVPSSGVILDCLRSMYIRADSPSPVEEYSSPLVVTSSSRSLPVSKVEALPSDALLSSNIKPQSSISLPVTPYKDFRYKPNTYYPETSLQLQNAMKLASLPNAILPTVPSTNVISVPSVNSLPLICLEALKRNINSLSVNGVPLSSPNLPTYSSFPDNKFSYWGSPNPSYSLPYPLRYNQLLLPDVLTPSSIRPPNISPINNLDQNSPNTLYAGSSYTPTLTKTNRVPQNSARISEGPNSFITTRVPTVPFSSSAKSYSGVQKVDNLRPSVNDPIRNRWPIDKGETISPGKDIGVTHMTPDFPSWNPYDPPSPSLGLLPELNIPDVKSLEFTTPVFNFEPSLVLINENLDFTNNFIIPDMQPTVDSFIDSIDCNFNSNVEYFLDVPKIPRATPNFIPIHESSIDNIADLSFLPLPIYSNNNLLSPILSVDNKPNTILELSSPSNMKFPPKIPITSTIPATYVNVSPSYSLAKTTSNAISSLNDVVSNLTRNILSSVVSYLTSPKISIPKPSSNLYGVPLPRRTSAITPSSVNIFNTKLSTPSFYSSTSLPLKTQSYYEIPLVPIEDPISNTPVLYADCSTVSCYDDISPKTLTYSNDITEPILDTISLPPLKVALLPPISFVDYIPIQPCPSVLPSPILPPVDTPASIVVQPQVVKIKSLDKKYKTVDKLLQLVFLAELFHREDIDWDALDAVLAVLCAN